MKRLIPVFGVLLIVALLVAPLFDATAQVKVKKIGRSLNQMTLPVKGSPRPGVEHFNGSACSWHSEQGILDRRYHRFRSVRHPHLDADLQAGQLGRSAGQRQRQVDQQREGRHCR